MTVFCSNLPNDQAMIKAIGSSAIPVPLFTDVCFSSIDSLLVACERKKIGDMVSCIHNGRFLFQMQKCKEVGCDILFLILEGRYRRNREDGLLEVPVWGINPKTGKRAEVWQPVLPATQFSRFDQYLTEIQRDAGILLKHTENVRGTADVILALYQNFQKPSDSHHSLKQMFKPLTPTVQLVRPSLLRRVVSELPGIGWDWSAVVADTFKSVKEMVAADIATWSRLTRQSNGKQRRLGKKTAERVIRALGGDAD